MAKGRIPEGYMSLPDASKELGFKHLYTIYTVIKSGQLEKYKIFGTSCVKRSDVEELKKPKRGIKCSGQ